MDVAEASWLRSDDVVHVAEPSSVVLNAEALRSGLGINGAHSVLLLGALVDVEDDIVVVASGWGSSFGPDVLISDVFLQIVCSS